MNRSVSAISSVALPVAFVGLAVVAAPEARGAADASWAARWVAQRTAERVDLLTRHLAESARESLGLAGAHSTAAACDGARVELPDQGEAASEASPAPPTRPAPRPMPFDLIDLPPPGA